MKWTKQFLFILFYLVVLSVFGQEPEGYVKVQSEGEIKDIFQKNIENIKTIQASFKQQKHLSIFSKTIDSEGTMAFKSPNKLKWAYDSPYHYVILIEDQSITIDDEGVINTFDLSASEKFSGINRLILNSITGKILNDERFESRYFENDNSFLIIMVPNDEEVKRFMNTIQIDISKIDKRISGLKLIENQSDFTEITFSDQVLNEPIPDEVFNAN